jgi:hypothetical protein
MGMQSWALRPRAGAPNKPLRCDYSHSHSELDVVVRSPNFDVSAASHTLGGARERARASGQPSGEWPSFRSGPRGRDSGGDPARKGLKCADRAGHLKGHPGNALQSRLVSIAPALFRGCEHASLEPTNAASHRFRPWVPRHPKRAFLARHLSSEQNVLSRS